MDYRLGVGRDHKGTVNERTGSRKDKQYKTQLKTTDKLKGGIIALPITKGQLRLRNSVDFKWFPGSKI